MIIHKFTTLHKNIIEILVVFIIILGVIFFTFTFERPLSFEKAIWFDANVYYKIAEQINLGQPIIAEAPFVYRLGTPFLVSLLFPKNLFLGYKVINLAGATAAIYLLLFWLRLYLKNHFVRIILITLFASHWLGVLRITLFAPIHVESIAFALNIMGLILVYYLKSNPGDPQLIKALSLTTFIGVFFRESVIFISLIYAILQVLDILQNKVRLKFKTLKPYLFSIVPFATGLLGILLTRAIVSPEKVFPLLGVTIMWLYEKPLPVYIQSYFTTFGPLLAVLIPSLSVIQNFLVHEKFNKYYLVSISLLAWVIGSDTDRFLYWAMPIWYIMFGLALEHLWPILLRNNGFFIFILLLQCLAQRTFLPYKDYAPEKILYRIPVLTVICNDGCGLDIPSYIGLTGSGLNAAMCFPPPCYHNGVLYPLQLLLFIENVFTVGGLVYLLLRIQTRFRSINLLEISTEIAEI